jgi:hypothetical protein
MTQNLFLLIKYILALKKINPPLFILSQVCEFVSGLAGCKAYSDLFRTQAIDGSAFMMLNPEHLTKLGVKMGPGWRLFLSFLFIC